MLFNCVHLCSITLTQSTDDFYEHQPQSSVGEALQQLLPQGCDTLIDYYIHVSAFVFAHSQADLIIKFGKLALTSIEAVHESKKVSILRLTCEMIAIYDPTL